VIYIETGSCAPAVNLAYEEYFLKGRDLEEDLLMLWRSEPTIVVGRFQNTLEEINASFAEAHHIRVIRRISGGGAVYHDLGNVCFSFILHDIQPKVIDKSKYIRPVVEALAQLGVHAELTHRNDLTVEGKKFSGNAMALHKNRLLFHGTLLFDADLEMLEQALKTPEVKILSKGVQSARSGVTNLKEYLFEEMSVIRFKERLKELLFAGTSPVTYIPCKEDLEATQELVKTKYETWGWNFGNNPRSTIHRSWPLVEGILEIQLELEKGCIQLCQLTGNFATPIRFGEVEKSLTNVPYTYAEIRKALTGLDLENKLGSISKDDLVQWIAAYQTFPPKDDVFPVND
jgi:lipoate---protein ligase